jgi:WD40 repeat protein
MSLPVWLRDPCGGKRRSAAATTVPLALRPRVFSSAQCLASAGQDGVVRVWDPATGIGAVMRVDGRLKDCAWSPSGQSLAAAGDVGLYHFTFKP